MTTRLCKMTAPEFSGFLTFVDGGFDSVIVKTCVLLDEYLVFNLQDSREELGRVRFLGAASKTGNGDWQTPWVCLTSLDGKELTDDEIYTRINITVFQPTSDELILEGTWEDWYDGEDSIFPFRAILKSI